jgi:eukaryotic-like serine/threonine-protein kinase
MTALGRYEIIDKIGAGAMGTVYRARDTVLDREIALKTIRSGPHVEPELRERFYREARACARLQHPSIVVVYDFGEIDQVAYIAMELLHGSDIQKVIDRRLEIPLAKKLDAMAQVCEALAYAHRNGIVHRDVKPSNLFVVDSKCTKVLDFGIARLPSSMLTGAGRILGTPNYMAPEQILGKQSDARADLFSAAVVFFELLVYSHPFKSDQIPQRIVDGEPDSLFDHDPKLPILLERVLQRAMAKDPEQRYRTGSEFAGDLRAILEGLRQNASPTFSAMQLPSEREVHFGSPEPKSSPKSDQSSVPMPPPAGRETDEWHLSEPAPPAETAASTVTLRPASSARQPSPPWWKPGFEWVLHKPRAALLSALGFVLLMVVVIIAVIPSQVALQPRVATALVSSTGAFLYKNASLDSTLMSVSKGERINILKLPLSRNQQWVPSQFVSGRNHKVYRPGYMRVSDLEGWDSDNADNSLALIRMFHVADASDTKNQAEMHALQSIISRFPGTRASSEANIDVAKLDLAATQALKDSGQSPSAWKGRLDSARAHLDAASGDPSLASDVDPLRRQLEALSADSAVSGSVPGSAPELTQETKPRATPAVSTTPAPASGAVSQPNSERLSKKRIEALLSEADSFWDQHNLDEAEKRVNRVLRVQKDNPRALELQEKIKKRKELLEKY